MKLAAIKTATTAAKASDLLPPGNWIADVITHLREEKSIKLPRPSDVRSAFYFKQSRECAFFLASTAETYLVAIPAAALSCYIPTLDNIRSAVVVIIA
jgi:hypothetical protein